jgi:glutamine amidotransferase
VTKRVAVVDYGAGNVLNVVRAFQSQRIEAEIVTTGFELRRYSHIVLPGVGSFRFGMQTLNERGLSDQIRKVFERGQPLLGICLGMQLFAESSSEHGRTEGLGLVSGSVEHLTSFSGESPPWAPVRAPHTGWSDLHWDPGLGWDGSSPFEPPKVGYFNHSYYLKSSNPAAIVATSSVDGFPVPAALRKDFLLATQFHPEKSASAGLALLGWWFSRGA